MCADACAAAWCLPASKAVLVGSFRVVPGGFLPIATKAFAWHDAAERRILSLADYSANQNMHYAREARLPHEGKAGRMENAFEALEASVKITIVKPGIDSNSMFGPGVAALCKGVRDSGSLYAAARSMGMAYSKAWRIMKDTEAALGMQLLNRNGAHGSDLTKEGSKLLDAYLTLSARIAEDARGQFRSLLD